MSDIDVVSLGLACPLGLDALGAYAALLANLRSIYRSEDALELEENHGEVVRASRTLSLPPGTDRSARARFFAQPALVDAMRPFDLQQPGGRKGAGLFLATPEPHDAAGFEVRGMFGELAGMFKEAHFFAQGRAGVFAALAAASAALTHNQLSIAVVGGVDSLADGASLERLVREQRLLGERTPGGMIPGEGAAFLVLGRNGVALTGHPPLARLGPLAQARDPKPLLAGAPGDGAGLSEVFHALARAHPRRVDMVHGAQTAQPFWAREISFAAMRCAGLMPTPMALRRRAEALGELGAAGGAVALVTAVLDFHALAPTRPRAEPLPLRSLVYASSDGGEVGACLLFAKPLHLLP